jgi:hypothetical protein
LKKLGGRLSASAATEIGCEISGWGADLRLGSLFDKVEDLEGRETQAAEL